MVIPTAAMIDRTMICSTAKLTAVSKPQIACPNRTSGFSPAGRTASHVTTGLAMEALLARPGGAERASRGGGRLGSRQADLEIGDQVLQIFQPDRDSQQAGRDSRLE
jgi:hypothetical protein